MMEKGMSVARLNFSHGDHKSHGETLDKVREAAEKTHTNVAIMLDTKVKTSQKLIILYI